MKHSFARSFLRNRHGQPIGASWALFGVMPACLWGVGIMKLHGSSLSMPLTNIAALILGLVGVHFLSPLLLSIVSKRPFVVAAIVFTLLAATRLDAGLDGVYRWLKLGPIRLHLGAIVTPLLLLALVIAWHRQKTLPTILMVATVLALYAVQPDAGQSTAFAAGVIAFVAIQDKRYAARFVLFILALLGASVAWTRPDPLSGVTMVEDIIPQAFAMHIGLGIGAVLMLGMLPGSAFLLVSQSRTNSLRRVYGFSLAIYFLTSIIVVFIGEFPTPVLGFGVSPIWGAMLGLGLLAQLEDHVAHDEQQI